MPIRRATSADLPTIASLIHELAAYEELAHEVEFARPDLGAALFGEDPAARVLLAEEDPGQVVGMALYYVTFSTFLGRSGIWLEDLFVRPEHRGRGHGSALIRTLRDLTDGRVEWAVLDWNRPAIDFYDRLGATPVPGWTRYRWR